MNSQPSPLRLFYRFSRPALLVGGALFYLLGAGIVRYLGHTFNWPRFWLGLAAVLLLLLTSSFLKAYYDLIEASSPMRSLQKEYEDEDRQAARILPRPSMMMAASTCMTVGAAVTVLLIAQGAINLPVLLILGAAFLLAFFYGVPPLRLAYTGYGEFVEAVLMTCLVPALAFLLQTGEMHRMVAMITFPLLALYLAARLALSLERYLRDQKIGRQTMMIQVGWQRGMNIHNILIPLAYALLAAASVIGLPWQLTWPGLLTLPLGLFEIFQMSQIAGGAKPGWRMLTVTAVAIPVLTAYLIALALWTS